MRVERTLLRAILSIGAAATMACASGRDVATASAECTRCHGGGENATGAPPRDVRGNADPGARPVGRHTAHVDAGIGCGACHPERPATSTPGHLDGKIDVALRGVSLTGGAPASFDARTGTCSNVYCHGATLDAGGARPALAWTGTLGAPRCAQCHGFPPPAPAHPQVSQCFTCHAATVRADGSLVAGGGHVNGVVDVGDAHPAGYASRAVHGPDAIRFLSGQAGAAPCASCHGGDLGGGEGPSCNECHASAGWVAPPWTSNCTFCHGTKDVSFDYTASLAQSAPPEGVAGEGSGPHVGAHAKHLAPGGPASNGFACATCHAVPALDAPLAHVDGVPAVALGMPAGIPPRGETFAPATQTCSNTYCHAPFAPANPGTLPAPTWTGGPIGCGGCHGAPPRTGRHPEVSPGHANFGCDGCHATVSSPTSAIVGKALHVNGSVEVEFPRPNAAAPPVGTWDAGAKTCTALCHSSPAPRAWVTP
jgi:predicted CxxxxCH...CXXCH cytochrome family protein